MADIDRRIPAHLWIVGVVTLLWNSFGTFDYTMTQMGSIGYLDSAGEPFGVDGETLLAFFETYPTWTHACWALGVWGALLGSILLLLRSRFAVWSFAVSLAGLAGTRVYQVTQDRPDWLEEAANVPMELAIWSIATFLLIYAISMRGKGVLR